jgi:predicted NAD/FAD-binding protein
MLLDVLRFNRQSLELLQGNDNELGAGTVPRAQPYGREFIEHYLVPMERRIWTARPSGSGSSRRDSSSISSTTWIADGPRHPAGKTVQGGAARYVQAITRPFADRIRLNCRVVAVRRYPEHVSVAWDRGGTEDFDAVVLAAHSDESLAMLADASEAERDILGAIAYQRNETVLHTDARQLPRRRRAWASWELIGYRRRRPTGRADLQPQSAAGDCVPRPDLRHAEWHARARQDEDLARNRIPPPDLQP